MFKLETFVLTGRAVCYQPDVIQDPQTSHNFTIPNNMCKNIKYSPQNALFFLNKHHAG